MLKTFLKPGWVLMLIFVAAFSYACFTVLSPWQLGKDAQIVERNHLIEEAYSAEPQPQEDILNPDGSIRGGEWARVSLTGHYLPDKEVLLRLRPVGSAPGFQSLVPFQTESGLTMLVNRGWVPTDEGNTVPEIEPAPDKETTIVGMVRVNEPENSKKPITEQGYQQVYSINTEQLGSLTGTELGADYVQLSPDQPGELNALPVPQLDRGNHLSYGYQWIAFGVMAPLGFAYFVWAEIRERRRAREEEELLAHAEREMAGSGPDPEGPDADSGKNSGDESSTEAADSAQSAGSAGSADTDTSSDAALGAAASAPAPNRRARSRYGDSKPDFYEKFRTRGQERF
ncbi:SURF1 family protein [Corynebacterium sp.]|uniref:SURF1 family cytochrome oxidase biogenesis protein n=1 Tax=Corynebacterium sp. TaxID=1720 RepID=UPI0026DC7C4B|nr:SURF1 family protein [Corynebacterium sp.]MDO5031314.1 SURF1 family protein [Corynebacterium sp.]